MPTREPRISGSCRCGAQWYGWRTVTGGENQAVLARHDARCGPPIGAREFQRLGYRLTRPPWWHRRSELEAP